MIIIISFFTNKLHCSKLNLNEKFCKNDELKFIFDVKNDIPKISKFIISLIISIIEMACTWLLIFFQTVNHLSVACSIHLMFRFLKGYIFDINHFILGIISLVLIFFFSLVFNEILILRFCKLDKNTNEEIEHREIEDKKLIERVSIDSSVEGIIPDE